VTPAVSVCIPTYNGGRFIGQAIESVLRQSFFDFELVIVDDASTDGTVARIEQFNDARIRLIRNEKNLGLAANWNKAVESCSAPLVKLLCHDDVIYPSCLATQVAAMAESKVGVVCSRRDIIDEAGRVVLKSRGSKLGKFAGPEMIGRIVRSGTNPLGEPAAVLFRAELLREVGGFRGQRPYMIDVDFYCRLLEHCDLIALADTLCAFRVWGSALSAKLAASQAHQAKEFFQELARDHPTWVSQSDLRIGQLRATLLAPMRRLLYRRLFPSDS
jgi:glycosyltransferase involved in cell wall biosynthesis